MKKNKGFTLIELIATVSLILMLFLVVVPVSTNLIQRSNKKHCETLVDELLANAELYAIDNDIKSDDNVEFTDLYEGGYIEDKYDFKNGYILKPDNMSDPANSIEISRIGTETDGYNKYIIIIENKIGKENICK